MPTITIRPWSVSGDWAATGGGYLNDDSDSTYQLFTNPYQYGTGVFSTTAVPWSSGAIVKSVKVRMKAAMGGSPVTVQVLVTTSKTGRGLVTSGDSFFLYAYTAGYTIYSTGNKSVAMVPGDGDINVSLHPVHLTQGSDQLFVSELYLDIEYIYPPSVTSIISPTGTYTTQSNPSFSYNFSSFDSLPQAARRLLVYSAAQYGATGFVPGVSAAVYDSGVEYTASTVGVLPALINGTYRFYVFAAQLVNGTYQWSFWTYNAYILNITPPSAPTVTPTVDSTRARIQLAIVGAGAANSVQDLYQLQRSFDGGTTWEAVRADLAGGYIDNVGGVRIWYDYETGNGQSTVYRAKTITIDTVGNSLTSDWGATSSAVAWVSTSTWLKLVTRPDLNTTTTFKEMGDESFDVPMGVFQGLDSDEAFTVSGVRRSRPDGSVVLLSQTAVERAALKAILATGESILVHANSRVEDWYGTSKYLSVGRVQMARQIRGAWDPLRGVTLPYTEVERLDTTAYLVEFGTQTWQDIDDAFSTFTAMSAAYTTYGAIRT